MQESTHIRSALQSTETSATFLNALIRRQYGDEAYEWDPLTVFLELKSDFDVELSNESMDRWSAMQVVMTSDAFFKRVDAFSAICNTLASGVSHFAVFDPVTVEEASWAIVEVALNRDMLPLSYPIHQYINVLLQQDGYEPESDPEPIKLALGMDPKSKNIVKAVFVDMSNKDNVEHFIDENLKQIAREFDTIPSMDMNDYIYKEGKEGKEGKEDA